MEQGEPRGAPTAAEARGSNRATLRQVFRHSARPGNIRDERRNPLGHVEVLGPHFMLSFMSQLEDLITYMHIFFIQRDSTFTPVPKRCLLLAGGDNGLLWIVNGSLNANTG